MSPRYAVYFAPGKHSPWRTFGAHWLGRDEYDNTVLAQPQLAGISPEALAGITQAPRRYGFHATLKAPFRLAPGHDEQALVSRLTTLACSLKPLALGPLRLAALDSFMALTPDTPPASLSALAAACVQELDDLRAPPLEAELARRLATPLDTREAELLACYGYPHVMERFRLHMTLTGPVAPSMAQRVSDAVTPVTARLNAEAPLWLDQLCLFVERTPGAPFLRLIDLKLQP